MPFGKWIVEPVFLCRNTKIQDKPCGDAEFETVVNGSFIKCLQQLASVVKIADRIFEDIASECKVVYDRLERLKVKIGACEEIVVKLDARAVQVPVTDLNTTYKFLRKHKPYKTLYEQPTQLFLPSNRPPCIDKLYNESCATPVSVICTVDRYHTDGCTSSQLFMVTPVLGGAKRKKRRKMLDIETRKPASFSLASTLQDDQKSGGVSLEITELLSSTVTDLNSLSRLPSPEEQAMATSMEYPSSVVPVDITGNSFHRMTQNRRSLIHVDFMIKRKKSKGKPKRRHTVCEGNNKEIEQALANITMVNSSCQTDDLPEATSTFFRRSFYRKRAKSIDRTRRETVALEGLSLDFSRDTANQPQRNNSSQSLKKSSQTSTKKQGKISLMTRATNPILSLSAALSSAVKMRHSKSRGKQDDGRSSSGNWSASSSTRASMDSDQHQAAITVDRHSNVSRSSTGKDSLLSDGTQQESIRSQDNCTIPVRSQTPGSLSEKNKVLPGRQQWDSDQERGRESSTSTPERSSDCASTPLVMSPYINRRNRRFYPPSSVDDGDSSVYSVDTDGYYTSMHTDSGLWNVMNPLKDGDSMRCRHRRESQSSISTIGNGSVNSILSRTVTEISSNTSSVKEQKSAPDPPPRISSNNNPNGIFKSPVPDIVASDTVSANGAFDKDNSPFRNGSNSESDHEARDRIRVKTTINSSRYPSLCAVSPETSDDELTEIREKSKSPAVSVVVAEVHREEDMPQKSKDGKTEAKIDYPSAALLTNSRESPSGVINMYGVSSSPQPIFSSSLFQDGQIITSTPKRQNSVTSFSSDVSNICDSPQKELSFLIDDKTENKSCAPDYLLLDSSITSTFERTPLLPMPEYKTHTMSQSRQKNNFEQKQLQDKSTAGAQLRSKIFSKSPLSNFPFLQSETAMMKTSPPSYISFQSPDSPVSSSTTLSPDSMSEFLTKIAAPGSAIDSVGQAAYSFNSLGRTFHDTLNKPVDFNCSAMTRSATMPRYSSNRYSKAVPQVPSRFANSGIGTMLNAKDSEETTKRLTGQPQCEALSPGDRSSNSQNMLFRPSRGGRFCRTYFPSHLISSHTQRLNPTSPPSPATSVKSESSISSNGSKVSTNNRDFPLPNASVNSSSTSSSISGSQNQGNLQNCLRRPSLPFSTNLLRHAQAISSPLTDSLKNTVHLTYSMPSSYQSQQHIKTPESPSKQEQTISPFNTSLSTPTELRMSPQTISYIMTCKKPPISLVSREPLKEKSRYNVNKQSEFTPPNPPDVIPSSSTPPSTLDVTFRTARSQDAKPSSPAFSDSSNLKSLSSSELFAIIHSSKKKHNIKTESEKSLSPLSSRSSSPAISVTSSPSKSPRIETGVLARQSKSSNLSDVSRSPLPSATFDRLGRAKPTSMHDFKMLLSQTRVAGNDSNARPTAAELLKVSPTKNLAFSKTATTPRLNSPIPKPSYMPQQNFATSPSHNTVPIKRGLRTRSPYLSRYDSAYPPILEDCSEELEASDENQNPVSPRSYSSSETFCGNHFYSSKVEGLDNQQPNANRTSTWV